MLSHFFHRGHRHHHFHFGRHHRGFQGFGFGPGQMFGGDLGRSGIGAGRKLTSSDLQLLILSLLAEKPQHGYEIIKSLSERSNGYYSPSPGMVYPALTYLEEIGHATVEIDGAKKRYSITSDGMAYLETNRANADTLLEQLAWIGQRMEQVRQAFTGGVEPSVGEDFDEPQQRGRCGGHGHHGEDAGRDFMIEIRRARRNLKAALIAKFGASTDEQKRIAEILERAARDIRGE
jgi:DNA-binding PadR family transcriptional regulator